MNSQSNNLNHDEKALLLKKKRSDAAKKGWITRRKRQAGKADSNNVEMERAKIVREAHNGLAVDYAIENSTAEIKPESFLKSCKSEIFRLWKKTRKPFKTQLKLHCEFQMVNRESGDVEKEEKKFMSSFMETINRNTDLDQTWGEIENDILEKLFNFMAEKSGWTLKAILDLHISISKYKPRSASSFIELPKSYKENRSIVNIQNNDNECGKWAVLTALHPSGNHKHEGRVTQELKEKEKLYNWNGVDFPMTVEGIEIFERNNKEFGIVAYSTLENNITKPTLIWASRKEKYLPEKNIARIFMVDDHWCWIKNENAFLNNREEFKKGGVLTCRRCFFKARGDKKMTAKDRLENHLRFCEHHDFCRETFPSEGKNILEFKMLRAIAKHPICISADFECLLERKKLFKKNTKQLHKHVPISCGVNVDRFDGKNSYFEYCGLESPKIFVEKLEKIIIDWYQEFKEGRKMVDKEESLHRLERDRFCWVCEEELGEDRRRDHDHYSGEFRGIAHNQCNLQLRKVEFIPVVLHNLSGYDASLFFKELVTEYGDEINIIPKNGETFISFSKKVKVDTFKDKDGHVKPITMELKFIDSKRFLNFSLESLAKNMDPQKFKNLKREFPDEEKFKLLCEKGIYPYDYMNCKEKLEMKELPPLRMWYNQLTRKWPTLKEYARAKKIWKVFGCKTMKDYHDIYLASDTLLLADIFMNFREMSLEYFKLDPAYFVSAPSLTLNAMLKKCKVKFPLFTEEQSEMFRMVEAGLRGGVTNCPVRFAEANNKYMKNYNPKKVSSFLKDLDENGLYTGIMQKMMLPEGEFEWLEEGDDWEEICSEKGRGCFLEVDLEYPEELHDDHNEFPLAVEKGIKLTPTLNDKEHYVLHYKALECYLKYGLRLKKIHRGIKFKESLWMTPYLDLLVELRKKAKIEKDYFGTLFFKLMANALFGKTLENVRNRVDIRIGTNSNFDNLVRKVNFKSREILTEDMSLIHMRKLDVKLFKPIILGVSILDLSKVSIIEFFYGYLKPKYGKNVRLLYTDTDSLILHIFTEDFYRDIMDDVEEFFDTSNFLPDHLAINFGFPIGKNEGTTLLMKDEFGGREPKRFIGLCPKLYGIDEELRVKGVKKEIVKRKINLERLNQCRLQETEVIEKQTQIRKRKLENYTERIQKVILTPKDTKRIVLEDKINTLAPGHWRLLPDGKYIPFTIPYPKRGGLGSKALRVLKG